MRAEIVECTELSEPPFLLLKFAEDVRKPDGSLVSRPLLFVRCHDPEFDRLELHQIPWIVGEMLAPDAMKRLSEKLQDVRAVDER